MKKLGKKTYYAKESIQAYACNACRGNCSCVADPYNHYSLDEDRGWSNAYYNLSMNY